MLQTYVRNNDTIKIGRRICDAIVILKLRVWLAAFAAAMLVDQLVLPPGYSRIRERRGLVMDLRRAESILLQMAAASLKWMFRELHSQIGFTSQPKVAAWLGIILRDGSNVQCPVSPYRY